MTLIEVPSALVIAEDVSSMEKGEHVSAGNSWDGYNYKDGVKVNLKSGKTLYVWGEDGDLLLVAWREFCKTRGESEEMI